MSLNRRFFENKSLFHTETHGFLRCACRVQRTLSNEASFEGITRVFKELSSIIRKISNEACSEEITRVFKELSSIIPKILCSVGEMSENRRFNENKSLFLTETHVF